MASTPVSSPSDMAVPTLLRSKSIISPESASVSCASLGPAQLLLDLNTLTNQHHTKTDPGVAATLDHLIATKNDFGTAYALLRPIWASKDIGKAWSSVLQDGLDIAARKAAAFQGTTITTPYSLPPRRIWDLHSHRVIPLHFARRRNELWAITHSWVADLKPIDTPVNQHEWPVPLPANVKLEDVREELLRLGAEYCWLDIVCTRQRGGPGEASRLDEWKVDVPTMGNVYVTAVTVVRYYNGLGRAFTGTGLDEKHHWLNRGWTLQELNEDTRIGGLPVPMPANMPYPHVTGLEYHDSVIPDPFPELSRRLLPLARISAGIHNVGGVVAAMRGRIARYPVDLVFGIGYLLRAPKLPVYDDKLAVEEAWRRLVACMIDTMRGELLFLFPGVGEEERLWMPGWGQLLKRDMWKDSALAATVKLLEDGCATYHGVVLEKCHVQVAEVEKVERHADKFEFFLHSVHCPPEGLYTLVASPQAEYLVVCKHRLEVTDILEKVMVVRVRSGLAGIVTGWGIPSQRCVFE